MMTEPPGVTAGVAVALAMVGVVLGDAVGTGALAIAVEDIDGVAETETGPPELRANPAAVPPALTIATVATTVTAANVRPAKSFPNPVDTFAPFPFSFPPAWRRLVNSPL
jgi:hypothetical protein